MGAIKSQLPATVELTVTSMILAVLMGVGAGSLAALYRDSLIDSVVMLFAVSGISMPLYWQGLLLIFLFSLRLGWLPATGQGGLERLILPAFTLGTGAAGTIARLTRSSVLEVLGEDYMRTARAKGLRERTVLIRHGLRNALIPVVTVVGLQFGSLLGGAVLTETVFARQGVGGLLVDAIYFKDFPMVQGTVFLAALAYMGVNLIVDVLYAFLDPRIQYAGKN